jgi:hypothetical protein
VVCIGANAAMEARNKGGEGTVYDGGQREGAFKRQIRKNRHRKKKRTEEEAQHRVTAVGIQRA